MCYKVGRHWNFRPHSNGQPASTLAGKCVAIGSGVMASTEQWAKSYCRDRRRQWEKFIVIVDEQWAAASHIPPLPGHRPDRAESECLLLKVPPSWIRGGWRQRRRHHSMAVKWLFWRHLSYFPLNWAKLTIVYHSVLRHNILTLKRWNFSNSPLLKTANFASRLLRPPRQSFAWLSSVA